MKDVNLTHHAKSHCEVISIKAGFSEVISNDSVELREITIGYGCQEKVVKNSIKVGAKRRLLPLNYSPIDAYDDDDEDVVIGSRKMRTDPFIADNGLGNDGKAASSASVAAIYHIADPEFVSQPSSTETDAICPEIDDAFGEAHSYRPDTGTSPKFTEQNSVALHKKPNRRRRCETRI